MTTFFKGVSTVEPVMYLWGIQCRVLRQIGLQNYTRDQSGAWQSSSDVYFNDTDMPPLRLSAFDYQLRFQASTSNVQIPGFGPAFANSAAACPYWPLCEQGTYDGWSMASGSNSTFSFKTMALNALYAIGEANRLLNEVGMQEGRTRTNAIFDVQGAEMVQRYNITYVPLLVFLGLLSCLFACWIVFGLCVYQACRRSYSFRTWRDVTTERLLVDVVDGLRGDPVFDKIAGADNEVIEKWAEEYRVQYVEYHNQNGVPVKIKLERVEKVD